MAGQGRGKHNSSLTRVRPFFGPLLAEDPSGRSWLPQVLATCPNRERLPRDVIADPGAIRPELSLKRPSRDKILGPLELVEAFERQVSPPKAFLRYLLANPAALTWPLVQGQRKEYSLHTQRLRTDLIDGLDEARAHAMAEGLGELGRHEVPDGRWTPWWMFEGFTEVDCYLETEKLLLFVEGKRRDVLSDSTSWYPGRNQLARNLEAVGELATGRACGVLLAIESQADEVADDVFDRSLPHLSIEEKETVRDRYLGPVTWNSLCEAVGVEFSSLPDINHLSPLGIDLYLSTEISVATPDGEWVDASSAAALAKRPVFVLTAWNPGTEFDQAAIFELSTTELIVCGSDASWQRRRPL